MSKSLQFSINGTLTSANCRPDTTVLEWLRGSALLRGTKEGCAEGDCGACSVLIKRPTDDSFIPANSCIMLMGQLEGAALMTVEGLATSQQDGHSVQQRMAENGSSQCGFCTPGIVCSLAGLMEKNGAPAEDEIHDALAGNLCRCTGYRPIVEAAQAAAPSAHKLVSSEPEQVGGEVGGADCAFHLPKNLAEMYGLLAQYPDATLLAGGTDIALDVAHTRARWPQTIFTRHVEELQVLETDADQLTIGGAVTWGEVLPELEKHWPSFATLVRRFGSTQIRSMGTIAGNLATASPIGDGAPSLLALNARVTLSSAQGERTLPLDDFFIGYRVSVLKPGEIIRSIHIPLPSENLQFRVYKISKRYDQDISTVCGAFAVHMDGKKVTHARVAYGGMAATPMRSEAAEAALAGRELTENTLSEVQSAIAAQFTPMDDMRGSAKYRAQVAQNLIARLAEDLNGNVVEVMAL